MAIFHHAENIIMERFTYTHNNILKFCGGHILIKFFFGCIIHIQKKFKKKRQKPASLKAEKQLNSFLLFF